MWCVPGIDQSLAYQQNANKQANYNYPEQK